MDGWFGQTKIDLEMSGGGGSYTTMRVYLTPLNSVFKNGPWPVSQRLEHEPVDGRVAGLIPSPEHVSQLQVPQPW